MLQRGLMGAANQLHDARKRMRDPDQDSWYLEDCFKDQSFVDRHDWLEWRRMQRKAVMDAESEHPTEIYDDLATESWCELCACAEDANRNFVL